MSFIVALTRRFILISLFCNLSVVKVRVIPRAALPLCSIKDTHGLNQYYCEGGPSSIQSATWNLFAPVYLCSCAWGQDTNPSLPRDVFQR